MNKTQLIHYLNKVDPEELVEEWKQDLGKRQQEMDERNPILKEETLNRGKHKGIHTTPRLNKGKGNII